MSRPRADGCIFKPPPRRLGSLLLALMLWAAAWGTAAASEAPWHHELNLRLNPESRQLAAEDVITIRGRGVIEFALGPGFTVEQLDLDGQPLGLAPQGEGGPLNHWRVDLGPSTRVGRLTVRYRGKLEPLPATDERGVLGRLPPMAGSRGTFLPGDAGWYPESAETTFTYRVRVDLPGSQRGVVPGRLVSEREEEGRYRATFEFDHPA
jgi:aminopeptidase N